MREVQDFKGYYVTETGDVIGKRGHVLKGKVTWDGYREVVLSDGNRRRNVRVHRLVAEEFIGECPSGMQVNHKDGDKLNNELSNLEYITGTANIHHAFTTGLCSTRTICDVSYLDFSRMLDMYNCGFSYSEIKDYLNFSVSRDDYIGEVLSGKKLKSLTGFHSDMRIKGQTKSKLYSDDDLIKMRKMREEGCTYQQITDEMGMSAAQISRILNGKRRAS